MERDKHIPRKFTLHKKDQADVGEALFAIACDAAKRRDSETLANASTIAYVLSRYTWEVDTLDLDELIGHFQDSIRDGADPFDDWFYKKMQQSFPEEIKEARGGSASTKKHSNM